MELWRLAVEYVMEFNFLLGLITETDWKPFVCVGSVFEGLFSSVHGSDTNGATGLKMGAVICVTSAAMLLS